MKLVLIEWADPSAGIDGWTDKRDLSGANVVPCVSIGIYVGNTGGCKTTRSTGRGSNRR